MTENMTMYHDQHMLVLNRPKGMRLGKALVGYGLYQLWNKNGRVGRKPKRQYHEWMKDWKDNLYVNYGMHTNMQLAELLDRKKTGDCDMIATKFMTGDMVIASINLGDRGLDSIHRDVVQIKLIEGDQACVKTREGNLEIYNLKNLQSIPKGF
jgi:hypothetical protein